MDLEQLIVKLRKLVANQNFVEARNLCFNLSQAYPLNTTIWLMRGDLHLKLGETDSVIECCQHIIAQLSPMPSPNPMLINVYRVLGTTYFNSGRMRDAIAAHEQLIAAAPNDAEAHTFMAICHLLLGDFRRGWPEYEWRLKTKYIAESPTGKPCWNGGPLDEKTILVNAEQGHGDTLQFVRYVRDVKARGGTVILGCQPALRSLLVGCAGVDRVMSQGEIAPP